MTRAEKALQRFGPGCNCAQAVTDEFAAECGLCEEQAHRMAAGFGGGMAVGSVCGALTGALMVLGLAAGPGPESAAEEKAAFRALVKRLMCDFEDEYGSVNCDALPKKAGEDAPACQRQHCRGACAGYVRYCVERLEELLPESGVLL